MAIKKFYLRKLGDVGMRTQFCRRIHGFFMSALCRRSAKSQLH
jgi:hypothetical protein